MFNFVGMNDENFMKQVVLLALKAKGMTSPNPMVGAVIVRGGKVIGRGYHKVAGGDHAEIVAIKDALNKKNSVRGATMYVNLEPCSHHGKTPPCCEELVHVGISRVVIAHRDPSSKVNGRGVRYLKKHGVEVIEGVLEDEARRINQSFLKVSHFGLPYVTVKAGMSLDGKIATRSGKSEWITNEVSRVHGHELRVGYDSIIVGANTVRIDNPWLGAGGKSDKKKILRVIVDGKLSTPLSSRVFRDDNVIVAYSGLASERLVKKFRKHGVRIEKFGSRSVSVLRLMKFLYEKMEVQSMFVEGGGGVHGSFFDAGVVDEVYLYISPEIIGGLGSVSVVGGKGVGVLKDSTKMKKTNVSRLKDDILVHGIVHEY